MDAERKRRGFQLMVALGFKEIEVGYPSASGLDFDFVRLLVKEDLVPDGVTVVVFTAARDDPIARTAEAVDGLDKAVVHLYTATAPVWRDVVLRQDRAGVKRLVTGAAERVLHSEHHPVLTGKVIAYAHCRGRDWQAWGAGIAGSPSQALAAAVAAAAARGLSGPNSSPR